MLKVSKRGVEVPQDGKNVARTIFGENKSKQLHLQKALFYTNALNASSQTKADSEKSIYSSVLCHKSLKILRLE